MKTFEAIIVVTSLSWIFFTKTWIGKSIINLIKSVIGLCRCIYLFTIYIVKNINNTNMKIEQKIDKKQSNAHKREKVINNKVIKLKVK